MPASAAVSPASSPPPDAAALSRAQSAGAPRLQIVIAPCGDEENHTGAVPDAEPDESGSERGSGSDAPPGAPVPAFASTARRWAGLLEVSPDLKTGKGEPAGLAHLSLRKASESGSQRGRGASADGRRPPLRTRLRRFVLSVRFLLLLSSLVFVGGGIALVWGISHYFHARSVQELASKSLSLMVQHAASYVSDQLLAPAAEVARASALNYRFGYASEADPPALLRRWYYDMLAQEWLFSLFLAQERYYGVRRDEPGGQGLFFFLSEEADPSVRAYRRVEGGTLAPGAAFGREGGYVPAERPWFREAAAGADGALVWASIAPSVSFNATGVRFLTAAVPLFGLGARAGRSDARLPPTLHGVLGVHLEVRAISRFFQDATSQKLTPNALIFATEDDGSLIALSASRTARDATEALADANGESVKAADSPNRLVSGCWHVAHLAGDRGVSAVLLTSFQLGGTRYFVARTDVRQQPDLLWHLFAAIPEDDLVGSVKDATVASAIANAVFFAVALTFSFVLALYISRPLRTLRKTMEWMTATMAEDPADLSVARGDLPLEARPGPRTPPPAADPEQDAGSEASCETAAEEGPEEREEAARDARSAAGVAEEADREPRSAASSGRRRRAAGRGPGAKVVPLNAGDVGGGERAGRDSPSASQRAVPTAGSARQAAAAGLENRRGSEGLAGLAVQIASQGTVKFEGEEGATGSEREEAGASGEESGRRGGAGQPQGLISWTPAQPPRRRSHAASERELDAPRSLSGIEPLEAGGAGGAAPELEPGGSLHGSLHGSLQGFLMRGRASIRSVRRLRDPKAGPPAASPPPPVELARRQISHATSAGTATEAGDWEYRSGVLLTEQRLAPGLRELPGSWLAEIGGLQGTFQTLSRAVLSFMKFVPNGVVRSLLRQEDSARLGMEVRYMTVMFVDIQDFTHITERMNLHKLVVLITEYFEAVTTVMEEHRATVDKYIGDALMLLWNAPMAVADHEAQACAAALACKRRLKELRHHFRSIGLPPLRSRFGIHAGECLVGNVGSQSRMNYTAVGDAVNLAARCESLNKMYGSSICITGDVYEKVKERFVCRWLDRAVVKGKSQPTDVYELVCAAGEPLSPKRMQMIAEHGRAVQAVTERRLDEARALLQGLLRRFPRDRPAKLMLERVEGYARDPRPYRPDGAHEWHEK